MAAGLDNHQSLFWSIKHGDGEEKRNLEFEVRNGIQIYEFRYVLSSSD